MAAAVAAVHESGVNFNKLEKVEAIPRTAENAKEGVETYADYKVSRTRETQQRLLGRCVMRYCATEFFARASMT